MAFAHDVKTEILENQTLRRSFKAAQGYGLLLCSKRFDADEISMTTERREVAKLYCNVLGEVAGIRTRLQITERSMGQAARHYAVTVESPSDRRQILDFFAQQGDQITPAFLQREGEAAAFISGAYLACGTATDPQKNYLLEFSVYRAGLVEPLAAVLEQVVGAPKFVVRRDLGVLYYRESEQIEDALTAAGAPHSAMQLMEIKIVKDMRNKVNRVTNCETANIDKTVAASSQQVASIAFLLEHLGMEGIPEELRETARKRLEYPELSLKELLACMDEPISRSGLNHRLNRLKRMAQELSGTGREE